MTSRLCNTCGVEKSLSDFYKRSDCRDGIDPRCKSCKKSARKSRAGCPKTRAYNKEYAKGRVHEYTPRRKELARKRYKEKKEHILNVSRKYRKENPELHRQMQAKRRAQKSLATPKWLTGCQKAHIKRTYKLAALMEEITGIPYHVDHIIPLKGKNVCGLHVPNNLQVLRADLNLSKSNNHE